MSFDRSDSVAVAITDWFCFSAFITLVLLSSPLPKDLTMRPVSFRISFGTACSRRVHIVTTRALSFSSQRSLLMPGHHSLLLHDHESSEDLLICVGRTKAHHIVS